MQNLGNTHIRPHGTIFIRGIDQKDLALLEVNQVHGAILPNGTRTYTASWDDGFIVRTPVMEDGNPKVDSKGNPVTELTINWNKLTDFRFGKYTATLLMAYDTGKRDETLEASTSFWVIPYIPLGIIIISLIVIILFIRWLLKAYINKELKKRK
jgi:hypothetical protein